MQAWAISHLRRPVQPCAHHPACGGREAFSISRFMRFVAPFNLTWWRLSLAGKVTVNGDLLALFDGRDHRGRRPRRRPAATAAAVLTGDLLAGGPFLLDNMRRCG